MQLVEERTAHTEDVVVRVQLSLDELGRMARESPDPRSR